MTVAAAPSRGVRLAMVGCGAITEGYHLPAALAEPGCEVTILVDADLPRVTTLGQRSGVAKVSADYRDVIGAADAALLALPNHLHADVACALLERGVHVLVEKPMAITVADCDRMIAAAERTGAVLAVAQLRRFWAPVHFVKDALARGVIGRVKRFEIKDGWVFGWALRSPYLFLAREAGGGCLMDMAPHLIELLLHWLGELTILDYQDDARGGVEANCLIRVATADGAEGTVEFSRTRNLGASIVLEGERGTLEMGAGKANALSLTFDGHTQLVGGGARVAAPSGSGRPAARPGAEDFDHLFAYQIRDFVEAIQGLHPPGVPGHEGRRSVEFVQRCYARRRPLVPSFMAPTLPVFDPGADPGAEEGA